MLKRGDLKPKYVEICYGGVMRNTIYALDAIYLWYLQITDKIKNKNEIKTNIEEEFRTISHPEFILIGRIVVVLYALLSLILIYLISKTYTSNNIISFIAPLALSFTSYQYLEHSTFANVDIPMVTWFLASCYFSLKYHCNKKIIYIYVSVWASSMAMATKLSGILAFVNPFLAFLLNHKYLLDLKRIKTYSILLKLFLVAVMNFLLWNPNIITDTENYVNWNKWIIEIYKTGGGHFSKEPGWEHFSFQLNVAKEDLGIIIFYGFWISILFSFVKIQGGTIRFNISEKYWIIFIPFFTYLIYMSYQKVAYHRNFMMLYPYLSIGFALTINELVQVISHKFLKLIPLIIIFIGIYFLFLPEFLHFYQDSIERYQNKDTRTQSIQRLEEIIKNKFQGNAIVGIAKDLQISEYDLKKITYPVIFFNQKDIDSASKQCNILVTTKYFNISKNSLVKADTLNFLSQKYETIDSIAGNPMFCDEDVVLRQTPHINPTILFLKGTSYDKIEYLQVYTSKRIEFITNQIITVFENFLPKGKYLIKIFSEGSLINNEGVHFKVLINGDVIKDFYSTKPDDVFLIEFALPTTKKIKLEIEMDNDLYLPEKGIDRNGFIRKVTLLKKLHDR
ncbi:glycosyltransferase family 39 protein [Raineya orbicola]|nr:carbohydrate-binding domain-containing protein [Raineya orbicola]